MRTRAPSLSDERGSSLVELLVAIMITSVIALLAYGSARAAFDTDDRRTVEAYVLDRDDLDLYDEQVLVEFVEHIRPTLRFDSIDDLMVAMAKDVEQCRTVLTQIVHS